MAEQDPPAIPNEVAYKAQIAHGLLTSDKTRVPTLRLLKELDPNLRIGELEQIDRVHETMAPALKRVEETEARLLERENAIRQREERQELVNRGIVAAEQFDEVQKFQTARGIGNFKDAAELYSLSTRAAEPRTSSYATPFTLPGTKELFDNRTQWARKVAAQTLNEFRGRR